MQIALEERTTGHVAYSNTENVLEILQEIDSSNISSRGLEMLERIRITFDFLKDTLDKVDPWLVSENTMNYIHNPILQVLSEFNNFKNDYNEQRLINILSYIEPLLTYLSQLVVSKTPEDIEGVRQSTIKFRQSVGQHLGHVERDLKDTSTALNKNTEKLNDLTSSIESQKTRIDSIVSEFQSQFLQTQNQRNEEFSTFIKKGEQGFLETLKSFEETFKQQSTTQQDTFDTLTVDFKEKAQIEIDQMNEMNKKAEKLLGIMSMKGLAQGYQKIANKEGWKALSWNAISIFSLLGILWFGYEFIIQHEGEMSWTALISRMVLTGVGITLFTYTAKQATNHRNEERRNRRIELELASLDPYLKDLEELEQKKVKQELVDKYFGVELPPAPAPQTQQQNITDTLTNNPQIVQLIADKVSQLISKQ